MANVPFYTLVLKKKHTIKYLLPNSQMLNPIENVFSKWKTYVKKDKCLSEIELLKAMDRGIETIQYKDVHRDGKKT